MIFCNVFPKIEKGQRYPNYSLGLLKNPLTTHEILKKKKVKITRKIKEILEKSRKKWKSTRKKRVRIKIGIMFEESNTIGFESVSLNPNYKNRRF